MQSKATTVTSYLEELPAERRAAIERVREVILANLPDGYEEAMNWGMIVYQVPLSAYPDTYNKQPLAYAALANQKNYMALYLMCVYTDEKMLADFEAGFQQAGKKLDMGKSCVRFKNLDDLPLEVVGRAIAAVPMQEFIEKAKQAKG